MTQAPQLLDGRRRRGQDNRERIVAAMMDLICAGEVAPSAEQVAERADVGLRTVFRHFQDMDTLYREISRAMERELRAIVDQPFEAQDWRGRLFEQIARRARIFEAITPFRRAATAFQHRSKFLGSDYAKLVVQMRERILQELPPTIAKDPMRLEALDLLMSFEAWARLRREQGLAPEDAQAVVTAAVTRLLEDDQASSSMSQ